MANSRDERDKTSAADPEGRGSESGQIDKASIANKRPDIILESIYIGMRTVQFYVDFGADSAIIGFLVENDSVQRRYFPMYGSTYRGLPAVTLEVFVSDSQEEMWVRSSWPGYEILAYHLVGTDRCITPYGEIHSFDIPTPESLGGGAGQSPEMDIKKVTKVATLKYDEENLTR